MTGASALLLLALASVQTPQARDWILGPFEKPAGVNPVLAPDRGATFRQPADGRTVRWQERATFNPAAVVRNDTLFVLFRAEDESGVDSIGHHTSRIGLAWSTDGLHYTRRAAPVLYPDNDGQRPNEWPGGVEDPRIVESEDGRYVLTYTQWNRDVPRLAVATSRDLVTWTKHGPAFAKADAKYLRTESKSGAILSRLVGDRFVATRVNGKYWMYFGVPEVRIATSDNLVDWTPLEDTHGRPLAVLVPRPGYFDSWLVEPGPPALLTEHGVVLLYNAGNAATHGDTTLPARIYTAGQALFDVGNPLKLLERTERPFLQPSEAFERTGQYREGTTFVEGLVRFRGRWHLFYGSADSRVGLAVWTPQPPGPVPQNPSPMRETTRRHERLEQRHDDPGVRLRIDSVLPAPLDVFVPQRVLGRERVPLVLHFQGATWVPQRAVAGMHEPVIVAAALLGAGSSRYARPFAADTLLFARMLDTLKARLRAVRGAPAIGPVYLSGWSAGYGAIREILRRRDNWPAVQGVLLIDGLHASYVPENRPLADGGVIDSAGLVPFAEFARAAARGEKRFVLTHSEIFPGTYASTTETSDWLLEALGMRRTPVLEWGPMGTQLLSRSSLGGFEVLGFAGNTAPDHVDQLHGMAAFLARLLKD